MAKTPSFKEIRSDLNRRYVNRLEEAMMDVGISTKAELARIVGVSYGSVTKGLKTGSLMNIHMALQIADALEISLDELFGVPVDQASGVKPPKKFSRTISRSQLLTEEKRPKRRVIRKPTKGKDNV